MRKLDLAATRNCVDLICHFFLDEKVTKKSSRFANQTSRTTWLGNSRFRPLFTHPPPPPGRENSGSLQIGRPPRMAMDGDFAETSVCEFR
jgi:hypothetical protein